MARPDKAAAVAEIAEQFRSSSAAVLTEYRGLTVSQLTALRRALGEQTSYAIVKNTLTKIAAEQAGVQGLDGLLTGPTAVAFVSGDPVEAAKGLRDFSRTNPLLVIKGGVLDGRPLDVEGVRKLADLESREVLLAKLAGAMNGSLAKAVGLFAAPLSQAARLIEARRAQVEADPASAPAAAEPVASGSPEESVATSADPGAGAPSDASDDTPPVGSDADAEPQPVAQAPDDAVASGSDVPAVEADDSAG